MKAEATVFVVDDDEAMRKSLERLMESVGLPVRTYASAEEFLADYDPERPGCLVLDICMPGLSGLDLQEKLVVDQVRIPTIIISAHGDVERAVRAMKSGAVDFIKKPYKGKVLLTRIGEALEMDAHLRRENADRAGIAARIARLTPREREVMVLLASGRSAKRIAFDMGLSRKTVDVHRGHIMMKMQAESLVELARMVQIAGPADGTAGPRNGNASKSDLASRAGRLAQTSGDAEQEDTSPACLVPVEGGLI